VVTVAESLAADIESVRNDVARLAPSREVSLALTKLDEARMWLEAAS
jgi:hypothetical protein